MCGIIGVLSNTIQEEQLKIARDTMHHRGPDSCGDYVNQLKTVFLGHRRLSILDLSSSAGQPFFSASKRYVIIFNGEVYNYRELAKKYKLHLTTTSDTEVVVELYERIGLQCVEEFNGMFAFAIYDTLRNETFLCRDRLGVKPLYLYKSNKTIIFASELKGIVSALSKTGEILSVNKKAIALFLHLGYIPSPNTIYDEVHKFPSGTYAIIKGETITYKTYWKAEDKIEKKATTDFYTSKNRLKKLIESSIEYRMISDVPMGTFLSGGIDSSLVTAVAQKLSIAPIKTFSIGFKEAKFNESVYAKQVANYLRTDHEEYILTEDNVLAAIERVMDNFDEPFGDSSALPTWLVSNLSSQKVKMILTGDGGDELFMGYGAYTWADRLSSPWFIHSRKLIYHLLNSTKKSQFKRAAQLFNFNSNTDLRSHIFSQEQYCFSQEEVERLLLLNQKYDIQKWIEIDKVNRNLTPKEKQALFDLNYYLPDDLLVKVDRASMLSSIEAREPLLDYRIVEFSLNLDQSLKVNKGVSKFLLKEVLYDYVPKEYFNRPKAGFSIPLGKWLKGELKPLVDKYLSEEAILEKGILNYLEVKSYLNRFMSGEDYLYNRIWMMIMLQRWLDKLINDRA